MTGSLNALVVKIVLMLIYLARPSADTQWRKTLQIYSLRQVFQTVITFEKTLVNTY